MSFECLLNVIYECIEDVSYFCVRDTYNNLLCYSHSVDRIISFSISNDHTFNSTKSLYGNKLILKIILDETKCYKSIGFKMWKNVKKMSKNICTLLKCSG